MHARIYTVNIYICCVRARACYSRSKYTRTLYVCSIYIYLSIMHASLNVLAGLCYLILIKNITINACMHGIYIYACIGDAVI